MTIAPTAIQPEPITKTKVKPTKVPESLKQQAAGIISSGERLLKSERTLIGRAIAYGEQLDLAAQLVAAENRQGRYLGSFRDFYNDEVASKLKVTYRHAQRYRSFYVHRDLVKAASSIREAEKMIADHLREQGESRPGVKRKAKPTDEPTQKIRTKDSAERAEQKRVAANSRKLINETPLPIIPTGKSPKLGDIYECPTVLEAISYLDAGEVSTAVHLAAEKAPEIARIALEEGGGSAITGMLFDLVDLLNEIDLEMNSEEE